MVSTSAYVFGLVTSASATGDPSPFTARGCYEGIWAAVKHKLGRDDLKDLKIAVQGVGNVGRCLCGKLQKTGVQLVVSDVKADVADYAVEHFVADAVPPNEIYSQDVNVFSPCAMGAVLNDDTILKLISAIVAGVANNQLAEERHGQLLHDRGILYAPDYVINTGGMLNASGDIFGEYKVNRVMECIKGLYDTTL